MMQPSETAEALERRLDMVRHIERQGWVRSAAVLAAMAAVPRHEFVGTSLAEAYGDHPVPIGHGQTISQPLIVAFMTEALALSGSERVLEIGTGCGYQAAVLSRLCAQLDSIERIPALFDSARQRLQRLGCGNVAVHLGDGYLGWPAAAPYDRVILTAAPPVVPAPLCEQLVDGGILVAPVGEGLEQSLIHLQKRGAELVRTHLCGVRFVPMVQGRGQS